MVNEQSWQGKVTCMRREDMSLNFDGCFWWLSGWKQCPTHTVAGMFELYKQLLPTRLYVVGSKSKGVLHNMQKAVISGTLNISRTFKVAT